jgi:5-methylcytosine-specific restriction endonuclease McrA
MFSFAPVTRPRGVTFMSRYSLEHLPDSTLLRELHSLVAQDRATTALLIAHLGETDARRLYAPAGYPSMFEYCIHELRFSNQTAFKRIRVARVARQFPVVYGMLADGRLNLSAVVTLSAHLTLENGEALLAAAANLTTTGIERLLAERFPQPDLPTLIAPLARDSEERLSARRVNFSPTELPLSTPAPAASLLPAATPPAKVAPLAPERYAVQCTVDQETHDLIRYAQALLGHSVPSGDLPEAIRRAFTCLVRELERQKFAKTERPRACTRSDDARHIPASVKRAVWERDGGQCTFTGENGRRCESRTRLEYDHVEPAATGGHATVKGLRLRCRAHNQLEAERQFGRDFMNAKRDVARHAAGLAPGSPRLPERLSPAADCCGSA